MEINCGLGWIIRKASPTPNLAHVAKSGSWAFKMWLGWLRNWTFNFSLISINCLNLIIWLVATIFVNQLWNFYFFSSQSIINPRKVTTCFCSLWFPTHIEMAHSRHSINFFSVNECLFSRMSILLYPKFVTCCAHTASVASFLCFRNSLQYVTSSMVWFGDSDPGYMAFDCVGSSSPSQELLFSLNHPETLCYLHL